MAQIHPSAVVDKEAQLADDVIVGPCCVIEAGVVIGAGSVLDANVVIAKNVKIGNNNSFHAGSVIGKNAQVLGADFDASLGKLEIGNGNVIRELVTIHSSMHPGKCTTVGDNNFLMVGVHIGHDCKLGDNIVMSNYCQIGGHCRIEEGAWLSGAAMLNQFVTLGKWCYAAGLAGINRDVPPFVIVSRDYPPQVRAVNKRGMDRAGLNEQQQRAVYAAFKKLYRTDGALLEKAEALAAEKDMDENVGAIVQMIINGHKHRFGRYLEIFRE